MSDTFLPASRPRRQVGFAGSMAFSAARGAALIGLAVIIGIVLLQVVDTGKNGSAGKGGGAITSSSSAASSTATGATTTVKGATTTVKGATTTAKGTGTPKTPAQLNVVVLNGSGTNGVAASLSSQLAKKGYLTGTPGNAAKRTGNVASCTAGLDREAAALATAVGPTTKVAPFPSPVPTGAARANCIVVVGS